MRWFHIRLGLIFAIPLVLISLTGMFLGFYDSLRYCTAPYRLEQAVVNPKSPAELAQAALSALPGARIEVLYLPTAADRSARVRMVGTDGVRTIIFMHPASGLSLARQNAEANDPVDLLHELHTGKLAGMPGEVVVLLTSLSLITLWLTGKKLRRRGSRVRHLHGRIGRATGGVLAFFALTGALLAYAKPLREMLYPPPVLSAGVRTPVNPAHVLATVTPPVPAVSLERVIFPSRPGQPLVLRFFSGERIWLDPTNGSVLRTETLSRPWLNLLYPLHSGRIFGQIGPPLVAACGLFLLLLTCSGSLLGRKSRG